MRETITISVPTVMRDRLDRFAKQSGLSRSDVLRESLSDYLFSRDFKELRARMTARAAKKGLLTDQDIFDRVS